MDEFSVNEALPGFFIDRSLVDEYCGSNAVDVYALLQETVGEGPSSFLTFLSQKGVELSMNQGNTKAILHGSGNVVSKFEPKVSRGGPNANREKPLVYATDDPDYAMFLAVTRLREEGMASYGYRNGKPECFVNLGFINGESGFTRGYVYVLNRDGFNEDVEHNFSSPEHQVPIFAIPVEINDMHTRVIINPSV